MNDNDFNDLLKKAADLPRAIPPGRDLWPEIEARLVSPGEEIQAAARKPIWFLPFSFAAAALVLFVALVHWSHRPDSPGWEVTALSGSPRVDAKNLTGEGTWNRGQWLETDSSSSARLAIGNIGEVRLDPNSRLRLLGTADRDHRLQLARGTLHALIWAPPRLFFVETPSATAIDLGCAYTLSVDDAGAGTLRVTSGYVALEHGGRTAFIPAGLICLTRPKSGPGTPFAETTAPFLREALAQFDFEDGGTTALSTIITHAAPGDEITLWHLLSRADATQRTAVFDKLASLHAPPAEVTREGIIGQNESMLYRWADELGLAAALAAH